MSDSLADDDDRALRALGQRAREQAWEAVALGERSEDEVATERLAAGDDPEVVARARALFRPPSEAEHQSLLDALVASQAAERPSHAPVADPTEAAANAPGRPWWAAAIALAAALVLAWWLLPGRSGSLAAPDPPQIALAPLPAYEALATDGGLVDLRSQPPAPGAVLRYRRGMELEWVLSPTVAAEGELAVRLFAFGEGTAKPLATDGLVQTSSKGAVRVAGKVDALGLPAGAWTIAVVVGRPAALPSDPAMVREAEGSAAWIVRRQPIVLED